MNVARPIFESSLAMEMLCDVHPAVQRALGQADRLLAARGQLVGHGHGLVHQFGARHAQAHQADALGFLAADELGRHQVVLGLGHISIMAEEAKITDGHVKIGVAAGDHAAILWPLLCGMAKAKYYLMTAEFVNGKEAERIGLVSLCVPRAELMDKAMAVANKLANGSQQAIRFTKRSLNGWMNMARPIFESSLAMEMLCFLGEDAKEGVASVREKRAPKFPSAQL